MATYTDSLGFNKGLASFPDGHNLSKMTVRLDFAKIIAARAAAGATALAAADVLQVMPIPAGTIILAGGMYVVKADASATPTFSLGFTGASPYAVAEYVAAQAVNATGLKATNLANPSVIVTEDTLDLLLNTAVPTTCIVDVFLVVYNANP